MGAPSAGTNSELIGETPRRTWVRKNSGATVLCCAGLFSLLQFGFALSIHQKDAGFGLEGLAYGAFVGFVASILDRSTRAGSLRVWGLALYTGTVVVTLILSVLQYQYGFSILVSRRWQLGVGVTACLLLVAWIHVDLALAKSRFRVAAQAIRWTLLASPLAAAAWCLLPPANPGISAPPPPRSPSWSKFEALVYQNREEDQRARSLDARPSSEESQDTLLRRLYPRIVDISLGPTSLLELPKLLDRPLGRGGDSAELFNLPSSVSIHTTAFWLMEKLGEKSATQPALKVVLFGRRVQEVGGSVEHFRDGMTSAAFGIRTLEPLIPRLQLAEARSVELELARAAALRPAVETTLRLEPLVLRRKLPTDLKGRLFASGLLQGSMAGVLYPYALDYHRFVAAWEQERTSPGKQTRAGSPPANSICELLAVATPHELRGMTRWHDTTVRLSRLAASLRRYELQTGSLPASIDDLTGVEPDALRDPYSDESFRYVRLSPRRYELYSVGLDGKDDGAWPLGTGSGRGDYVFGSLFRGRSLRPAVVGATPPPKSR